MTGIQAVRIFEKTWLHYDAQYLNETIVDSERDKRTNRGHIATALPSYIYRMLVNTCGDAGWRLGLVLPQNHSLRAPTLALRGSMTVGA